MWRWIPSGGNRENGWQESTQLYKILQRQATADAIWRGTLKTRVLEFDLHTKQFRWKEQIYAMKFDLPSSTRFSSDVSRRLAPIHFVRFVCFGVWKDGRVHNVFKNRANLEICQNIAKYLEFLSAHGARNWSRFSRNYGFFPEKNTEGFSRSKKNPKSRREIISTPSVKDL